MRFFYVYRVGLLAVASNASRQIPLIFHYREVVQFLSPWFIATCVKFDRHEVLAIASCFSIPIQFRNGLQIPMIYEDSKTARPLGRGTISLTTHCVSEGLLNNR